jgi:hypoxanthine phosphoribosyltransferase
MPFGTRKEYSKGKSEADFVYKRIIVPAVQKALSIDERSIVREVDNSEAGLITRSIIQRIAEAPLVIADITGHNGNVFFEMGVRYALKKRGTILIRQPDAPIPFDLANFRHHTYELFDDLVVEKLAEAIAATVRSGGESWTDSPVYEVIPSLEVAMSAGSTSRMSWGEYQDRIDKIRERLIKAHTSGAYRPDAIIGITKGGASFADLLTQRMTKYKGATLALWADRDSNRDKRKKRISNLLFDNPINRQMLLGMKEHVDKEAAEIRILLTDEVVASGFTYGHAIDFINDVLPGCHLRFLPMVYTSSDNYDLVSDRLLWKHAGFNLERDEIDGLHLIDWKELPWGKDIRRT